jgi:predicted dehydrogenase
MVQVGTQSRSSTLLRQAFDELRGGQLGSMRDAHALVYRARDGIGMVNTPTPVPSTADYDLWCGPAPKTPLMRKQLHYEWHWFWATGNGEMGNNGPHVIDLCRWALGQNQPPPRALSIGGRFAFNDCGETANTHIALFDYQPAPLICEIRNVSAGKGANAMGKFRNQNRGILIDCEGGYFAGDATGGAFFDKQGQKIRDLPDDGGSKTLETTHLANFIAALRSRKSGDLVAEALQGHLFMANSQLPRPENLIGLGLRCLCSRAK